MTSLWVAGESDQLTVAWFLVGKDVNRSKYSGVFVVWAYLRSGKRLKVTPKKFSVYIGITKVTQANAGNSSALSVIGLLVCRGFTQLPLYW